MPFDRDRGRSVTWRAFARHSMERAVSGDSKGIDCEQALSELEGLVERLERGDLPLDEALKAFERGVALTRHCQTCLQAAQQKVDILLKRSGQGALPEPFEEAEAAAATTAPE
jgi:exodeoxyribonuclease VII small subunit